jgi:hypothetical protein
MSKPPSAPANIFFAESKFERKARRPGAAERELALQKAQAEVDSLKTDFTVWIDQEVTSLNLALEAAGCEPGNKAAVELALTGCLQLRDVGGTMGYYLITFIATTLAAILEAVLAGAPYDNAVVDCHTAAFKLALLEDYRHLRPDQVPELTAGLSRMMELTKSATGQAH